MQGGVSGVEIAPNLALGGQDGAQGFVDLPKSHLTRKELSLEDLAVVLRDHRSRGGVFEVVAHVEQPRLPPARPGLIQIPSGLVPLQGLVRVAAEPLLNQLVGVAKKLGGVTGQFEHFDAHAILGGDVVRPFWFP